MLTLQNITKTFPGYFKPTLKEINLKMNHGDFCMLIGANGSGKSTLTKIISGEYSPDQGNIILNGKNLTQHNRSKWIAQVTQEINRGIIPEMTLLENMVLSHLRTQPATLAFYRRRQATYYQQVQQLGIGLEQYLEQPLATLSGGQKQMLATLMAIHSHPALLLLDEHTSALDPHMQQKLMQYTLQEITQRTITCLMITHKLDDAIQYGNRLIMLHQGQIVFDVRGAAKANLSLNELLALFHHYEDLSLTAGEAK